MNIAETFVSEIVSWENYQETFVLPTGKKYRLDRMSTAGEYGGRLQSCIALTRLWAVQNYEKELWVAGYKTYPELEWGAFGQPARVVLAGFEPSEERARVTLKAVLRLEELERIKSKMRQEAQLAYLDQAPEIKAELEKKYEGPVGYSGKYSFAALWEAGRDERVRQLRRAEEERLGPEFQKKVEEEVAEKFAALPEAKEEPRLVAAISRRDRPEEERILKSLVDLRGQSRRPVYGGFPVKDSVIYDTVREYGRDATIEWLLPDFWEGKPVIKRVVPRGY